MAQAEEEERRVENGPNGGDVVVGSVDVNALYPSLLKKESAKIIRELIEEMELEGVDCPPRTKSTPGS